MSRQYQQVIFYKGDVVEYIDGEIRKVIFCDNEYAALAKYETIPQEDGNFCYREDFEDVAIFSNNPFFIESTLIEVVAINGKQVEK